MIRRIAFAAAVALTAAPALADGLSLDLPHLTWPDKPATDSLTTGTAKSR